jgi:hypothetical protein
MQYRRALLASILATLLAANAASQSVRIDLASDSQRQSIVDREPGQYLGHPTTLLLEDGQTMHCVYPQGHGRGAIVLKTSRDGGQTWGDRRDVPNNWSTSREVPTLHRVVDAEGTKRIIMWSGLYPARLAVSDDDGETWSPLKPAGDWGGIVVMSSVIALKQPGHYLALFHDDGRFFAETARTTSPATFTVYTSLSGGLTWDTPRQVWQGSDMHLCEPGAIRSPDGNEIAVMLRENRRVAPSQVIFSRDEGESWSAPQPLASTLMGDRHTAKYAPDGRLVVTMRDTNRESATNGDWVVWVGHYDDLKSQGEGEYFVRLMDNKHQWDCGYAGLELLPDGTFVSTSYGHWQQDESPYVVSVRFSLDEVDELAAKQQSTWRPLFNGKSLEGWTKANGQRVTQGWVVEDGLLHRKSGGGAIYTSDEFDNFELRFTWRINANGNAGVKYRVQHYRKGVFGNPGLLGYEYQIFDDRGKLDTKTSAGSLYALIAPPADKPIRPVGEWNDSRIVADGTHIEHWLNGTKIVDVDTTSDQWNKAIKNSKFGPVSGFASVARGRIELQDHGHPVWFKRIEIKPLGQ